MGWVQVGYDMSNTRWTKRTSSFYNTELYAEHYSGLPRRGQEGPFTPGLQGQRGLGLKTSKILTAVNALKYILS